MPRFGLRWSSSQQHSHAVSCQFPSTVLSLAVWPELAQLDVLRNWKETEAYKNDIHLLPTELDEKVAKMRLPALGTVLTVFGDEETKNSSCVDATVREGRECLPEQHHLSASPRSRAVGTLCVAGPLTTSFRGLWVSGLLPPDPKTDRLTQGAHS